MTRDDERCACGRPLHYRDPLLRALMDRMVAECGPTIHISTGGRTWKVQRHWLALHGLKATELAAIAQRLHFEEVIDTMTVLG